MSRIITLLVLIVPLSLAGIGLKVMDGGGKKKKKEAKQEEQATPIETVVEEIPGEEAQPEEVPQQMQSLTAEEATDTDLEVPLPEAEGAVQVEEGDLWETWTLAEDTESEFYRERVLVSSELASFIHRVILTPISESYDLDVDMMSFSRCPTGMDYAVLQKPENGDDHYYGIVEYDHGCDSEILCKFRINSRSGAYGISSEKVDYRIWQARTLRVDGEQFVSVSQWISDHV